MVSPLAALRHLLPWRVADDWAGGNRELDLQKDLNHTKPTWLFAVPCSRLKTFLPRLPPVALIVKIPFSAAAKLCRRNTSRFYRSWPPFFVSLHGLTTFLITISLYKLKSRRRMTRGEPRGAFVRSSLKRA